jgi:hypothetical protein
MSRKNYNKQLNKVKDAIHVVNLASYTAPEIVESKRYDWVEYGDDNMYFKYLIDRYNGSPTNNASINGISEMIYGRGLDATDSETKPREYKEMKELFKKDCMKKVCYDYKMMGQAAVQVIYSKDRSKIAQVAHMPIETLRAEKAVDGEIKGYYYSSDWSKVKTNDKPNVLLLLAQVKIILRFYILDPIEQDFITIVQLIIKEGFSMLN